MVMFSDELQNKKMYQKKKKKTTLINLASEK